MHKIKWSLPAINDLQSAFGFISEENPKAARRIASRIQESVEYLEEQPNMGRPGRLEGTRELVVSGTPFVVVYWGRKGCIQILRILHHARKWP